MSVIWLTLVQDGAARRRVIVHRQVDKRSPPRISKRGPAGTPVEFLQVVRLPGRRMDARTSTLSPLAARVAATFADLAAVPPATLERIARHGIYRKVPEGTVMFSERTPCQGFPLVLAGSVRVVQQYPNGRELQLYRIKAGESCLLSGSCLLGSVDYVARGIAESDVELLIIPGADFKALVAEDEAFRSYVFALYGERLATLLNLVEAIAYQKLDQRLAALLLKRADARPATIHATHQALADELGSVREIVTRLLRSFEDRGWVELGRERIVIRDSEAIAGLARS
jgi:CRP/FNR family transcriptional regulator